jgi:hypothetical protein
MRGGVAWRRQDRGAERSEGWVVEVAEEWGIWRRGRQVPVPSPSSSPSSSLALNPNLRKTGGSKR